MSIPSLWRKLFLPFVLVAAVAPLPAQDAIRGWTGFSFDTDAYRLPATFLTSGYGTTAIIRSDGRLFVHGRETGFGGICNPPAPPPGLQFVFAALSSNSGVGILSDGTMVDWDNNHSVWPPPPPLPAGVQYVSASVAPQHALAMRSDGVLVGWASVVGGGAPVAVVPTLPPGVSIEIDPLRYPAHGRVVDDELPV